jgi:hypothetical protein
MAIGTPVPQEDLHPSVYVPQAISNVVPAEDMSGSNSAAATESSTLQPEAAYPAVGAGAALAAQGAGRAVGSKNWFNSDFPEYHPSEPNPLHKNPGEFTDGTYKPGSPYTPGVYAPGKPYAPGPEFVRREFPGLPAELDKGPNAVENFALSQHKGPAGEGQFFGGQDYGDAYARAMEAKQFNAGSTGFVVPQGGTPLALPPEIAAQKEQEYKAKLEAERAQREEGARVIHEQQEDKRQTEHNRAEAARRQAHEDREAHRLKTFNDIERQRRDNHAAMEQEKQNRFLTSESERQGAHASRQAEYQLARRAEDVRMAQEANQIAKSKLIGMANKLPGQIPLAGWNAGEAAERFQEPGIRNKIAGAVNAAGAVAPFLSHVPKIGKYAGLIGPGAAGLAHLIADEPQGHKAGGHIQHFGGGKQVLKAAVEGAGKAAEIAEPALKSAWEYGGNTLGKASEFFGNELEKAKGKNLFWLPTEADRMSGVGGPSFSANQIGLSKIYKNNIWGSAEPGIASRYANIAKNPIFGGSESQIWSPLLGSETQHQGNQIMFDELLKRHKENMGKLSPEAIDTINNYFRSNKVKAIQDVSDFDIRDIDRLKEMGTTFPIRAAIASHGMNGVGTGGAKGRSFDYLSALREFQDPMTIGAPTHSMGPRAFQINGVGEYRPDLNAAFPQMIEGKDKGVLFNPVPKDLALMDYTKLHNEVKGDPGYMGYTKGLKTDFMKANDPKAMAIYPRQAVTRPWVRELEANGFADGGQTRNYARGGLAHLGAA